MSTRGCVAVRTGPETWRGIFNHWDSYPTALGKEVWQHARRLGIERLARKILKFGDWEEYRQGGVCAYCGKKAGQPHTIRGEVYVQTGRDWKDKLKAKNEKELAQAIRWGVQGLPVSPKRAAEIAKREWPIIQNTRKTGFPDPEAKYHQHGEGVKDQLTESKNDPLFIEWVYILDPKRDRIEVWASRQKKDGSVDANGIPKYEHFKVSEVKTSGPEPDWEKFRRLKEALLEAGTEKVPEKEKVRRAPLGLGGPRRI